MEIPYQPTFVAQVREGNVSAISAKGTAIDGTFKQDVRYPDAEATATTDFKTEVPEFANRDEPRSVAGGERRQGGRSRRRETPLWLTVLIYVGPTLLIFAFFYWYMRRAAGGAGGMFTSFGRAKAKQYAPTKEKVTFADVAGIEEAEQELAEVATSPRSGVPEAWGEDPARCALERRARRGRRCWHGRSQARPASRSSMSRPSSPR